MDAYLPFVARLSGWCSLLMGLVSAWAIVAYAPVEKIQGPVQKLMYVHVPAATISYVGFILSAIVSAFYLARGGRHLDRLAACSAELGLLFCSSMLISGPLWARPIWGTFWVWDARLTSALLLWLIFVAYFALRKVVPGEQGARFSAVLAIIGVLDIPFIKVAAEKFRTMHPSGVVKGGMTPEMGATLMICMAAMLVFFVYLLARRLVVARETEDVQALREQLEGA